jgi:hypothetical protein
MHSSYAKSQLVLLQVVVDLPAVDEGYMWVTAMLLVLKRDCTATWDCNGYLNGFELHINKYMLVVCYQGSRYKVLQLCSSTLPCILSMPVTALP